MHVPLQAGKKDWRKASEIDKVSSREKQNEQKQTENKAGGHNPENTARIQIQTGEDKEKVTIGEMDNNDEEGKNKTGAPRGKEKKEMNGTEEKKRPEWAGKEKKSRKKAKLRGIKHWMRDREKGEIIQQRYQSI